MNHTDFAAETVSLVEREAIAYDALARLEVTPNAYAGFDFTTGGRVTRVAFDDDTVVVNVFENAFLVLESQATFTGFPPAVVAVALTAPLFA